MLVPRLVPGDRVRSVSPASPPTREAVARGAEVVSGWGLRAERAEHLVDRSGSLAAPDEVRPADLDAALRDPGGRAVLATTGGKRAHPIAPDLDVAAARAHPEPVVGQIDRCSAQLDHAGLPGQLHGVALGTLGEFETTTAGGTLTAAPAVR